MRDGEIDVLIDALNQATQLGFEEDRHPGMFPSAPDQRSVL
jgi:hypothetical protein